LLHVLVALLRRKLPLGEATLLRLLRWPVESMEEADRHLFCVTFCLPGLTKAAENFAEANAVSPGLRAALKALIRTLRKAYDKDAPKYAARLQALLPVGRKHGEGPGPVSTRHPFGYSAWGPRAPGKSGRSWPVCFAPAKDERQWCGRQRF
jgi:hypothetical protein